MLFSKPETNTVEVILDKFAVKELIKFEPKGLVGMILNRPFIYGITAQNGSLLP